MASTTSISRRDIEFGESSPLLGRPHASYRSCCQYNEITLQTAELGGQILFGCGAVGLTAFYTLPGLVPIAGALVTWGLAAVASGKCGQAAIPAGAVGLLTGIYTWHPLANVVQAEAITALKWGVPPIAIGGLVWGMSYCLKPHKEFNTDDI